MAGRNSTSNQKDVIQEYAKRRGLEIVRVYSDEGKSGLNIQGRDSLTQMIQDVENKAANFSCILVYDVSYLPPFGPVTADVKPHYSRHSCNSPNVRLA